MQKKAFQKALFQHVIDASSLINIERNRNMTQLRRRKGEILIPVKVAEEVNQPNTPLSRFIDNYPQIITQFQNNEEEEYLRVRRQVGIDDGEAAAIAISFKRKIPLVIDDKRGKEKAENHGIQTLGWKNFIREGRK